MTIVVQAVPDLLTELDFPRVSLRQASGLYGDRRCRRHVRGRLIAREFAQLLRISVRIGWNTRNSSLKGLVVTLSGGRPYAVVADESGDCEVLIPWRVSSGEEAIVDLHCSYEQRDPDGRSTSFLLGDIDLLRAEGEF